MIPDKCQRLLIDEMEGMRLGAHKRNSCADEHDGKHDNRILHFNEMGAQSKAKGGATAGEGAQNVAQSWVNSATKEELEATVEANTAGACILICAQDISTFGLPRSAEHKTFCCL
jgi:hypothetical protein